MFYIHQCWVLLRPRCGEPSAIGKIGKKTITFAFFGKYEVLFCSPHMYYIVRFMLPSVNTTQIWVLWQRQCTIRRTGTQQVRATDKWCFV